MNSVVIGMTTMVAAIVPSVWDMLEHDGGDDDDDCCCCPAPINGLS